MTFKEVYKKIKRNRTVRLLHLYNEKFQVRVLKRGTLKNHILVKYLFKDLFLYFLVSFFFFFMILGIIVKMIEFYKTIVLFIE